MNNPERDLSQDRLTTIAGQVVAKTVLEDMDIKPDSPYFTYHQVKQAAEQAATRGIYGMFVLADLLTDPNGPLIEAIVTERTA